MFFVNGAGEREEACEQVAVGGVSLVLKIDEGAGCCSRKGWGAGGGIQGTLQIQWGGDPDRG